jgi:hypothetical protein
MTLHYNTFSHKLPRRSRRISILFKEMELLSKAFMMNDDVLLNTKTGSPQSLSHSTRQQEHQDYYYYYGLQNPKANARAIQPSIFLLPSVTRIPCLP